MAFLEKKRLLLGGTLALALVAPLLVRVPALATPRCASDHGRPHLTGFAGGFDAGSQFYAGGEGGSATVTVGVTAGHCVNQNGSTATYQTDDSVATTPGDYEDQSNTTELLCADVDSPDFCPPGTQPQRSVNVPLFNDTSGGESAVEPFVFRLVAGQPFGLAEPTAAPIHIVDGDGNPRASLEPTVNGAGVVTYSRSESFARILIPVFAAGTPMPSSVSYTLTPTGEAPARPGEDFVVSSPNPLPIPPSRVGFIEIGIVNDKVAEPAETVEVALPGGASPSTTTLTIEDNEENQRPSSRLHHPRHGWRYKKSDYRIREVHIFTTDQGGSGVVGAQFALRRNMRNGDCQWLTKSGWQKKDCQNREWLASSWDPTGELWRVRLAQLKSSVGTRIKNYTAFSRAIDGAGNIERDFAAKRNANTFEVKRARRR